jgi:hypothetical protein
MLMPMRSAAWRSRDRGKCVGCLEAGEFRQTALIAGPWRMTMLDMLFLALGLGFFAACCLYLYACDRL